LLKDTDEQGTGRQRVNDHQRAECRRVAGAGDARRHQRVRIRHDRDVGLGRRQPDRLEGRVAGASIRGQGIILQVVPERVLEYSHFSPLAGVPDVPKNYHIVTVELSPDGERTRVTLSQDNNPTEQAREHSEKNWGMMLAALKQFLER